MPVVLLILTLISLRFYLFLLLLPTIRISLLLPKLFRSIRHALADRITVLRIVCKVVAFCCCQIKHTIIVNRVTDYTARNRRTSSVPAKYLGY